MEVLLVTGGITAGLCWQQGAQQGCCTLQVGYEMCVRVSTAFLKVCAELRGAGVGTGPLWGRGHSPAEGCLWEVHQRHPRGCSCLGPDVSLSRGKIF